MAHRNDAIIVGRVGTNVKFKKAKSGSDYISFSLEIEAKSTAREYDYNHYQIINVTCFKKPVIDYLQRIKIKQGNTAIIFGFYSSTMDEVKGQRIAITRIVAHEVYIVKTKPTE